MKKQLCKYFVTGDFPKTTELLEKVTNILTSMERFDRINRIILYRILLKLFNEDSVAGRNILIKLVKIIHHLINGKNEIRLNYY